MNYEVFTGSLQSLDLSKRMVINTINPHSYVTAKNDKYFFEALQSSDFLIPDGSGIVLAARKVNKQIIKKIAGADLHEFLLEKMNKSNGKVFYMGSQQETLDIIMKKTGKEYPHIKVSCYSPPFKEYFTHVENDEIINKINKFSPDVLLIGMTAPKQEKWLHANRNKLDFTVASCIGAVFDFYAGTVERPSQLWINLHLEWLARFLNEPRRLWRRNLVSTPIFLIDMVYQSYLRKT
jgi:N-acetylglucosaminyldiphosphoundecaprenol N-acetyl-beta-D-mannosaminyltransferase